MAELKPLVIERDRWLRGDSFTSILRNSHGEMCCLGFACLAEGLLAHEMLNVPEPTKLNQPPTWSAVFISQAIAINDDLFISEEQRERALVPALEKLGFAVTFK